MTDEQPADGEEPAPDTKAGGPTVCADCGGTGRVGPEPCPTCGGEGGVDETVPGV